MVWCCRNPVHGLLPSSELSQASSISHVTNEIGLGTGFLSYRRFILQKPKRFIKLTARVEGNRHVDNLYSQYRQPVPRKANDTDKELTKKARKPEHHLWMKRDSAGSGQKALNLVRIVSDLPNDKETVYGALDKWTAWEVEFPLVAAAKALRILRKRNQWLRIIQVTKWLMSKGQVLTMGTYDTLLLAFDMDGRVDEAEPVWNMIIQMHTRSVSKRLFSRMISLYDHHHMPEKIIEVFADMEELGVRPDDDTVKRVSQAFQKLGQEEKQKQLLRKYQRKWKYLHFNGERVKVRTNPYDE